MPRVRWRDVTVPSSLELLTHRLDLLRADRAAAMTDSLRDVTGDVADRATNVEASIRLQLLDERIALLELEIDEHPEAAATPTVSCRWVTPSASTSATARGVRRRLGRAGRGRRTHRHAGQPAGPGDRRSAVGSTVTYEPRPGVTVEVRILERRPAGTLALTRLTG